ncbi:MAG: NADH:ubiquinone reductase (Na(+)-transporting) subunit C [Saprospiraceae bacterium]|nr:NADH:ubiquinone reductase (Na(+)-transporting) subunit C [Saprospiraceae bacterium]
MHTNRYTFIYAAVLTIIAALLLAFASEGLKSTQQVNIILEKKANILKAARIDVSDKSKLGDLYNSSVEEVVIDTEGNTKDGLKAFDLNLKDELAKPDAERSLPLYVFKKEDGKKIYILPLHGVGLWGPIWGFISIEDDFNTVYGANFDHKGETPGLGAEIATTMFSEQFPEKKLYEGESQDVALKVVKFGTGKNIPAEYRVDGISGGTITTVGTSNMIRDCITLYQPYFGKLKTKIIPQGSDQDNSGGTTIDTSGVLEN